MITVRKSLTTLRHKWEHHAPESPLYFSDKLVHDTTVAQFCVDFVLSQKRLKKDTCAPP